MLFHHGSCVPGLPGTRGHRLYEVGLVFACKCLEQGRAACSRLLVLCKGLLYRRQLLDRYIKVKIKGRGDAELCKRMLDCSLYKSINDLLVLKLYFLFGGMYVHVNLCRVEVDEQHIGREAVRSDHLLVGQH